MQRLNKRRIRIACVLKHVPCIIYEIICSDLSCIKKLTLARLHWRDVKIKALKVTKA